MDKIILQWILIIGLFVIQVGVLYYIYNLNKFISSLKDINSGDNLIGEVRNFSTNLAEMNGRIDTINNEISGIKELSKKYVQKIGLMRYNPYDDTGGDQSFVTTFLDTTGTGVVISSLHSRENTRVYAKPVVNGKEAQYSLSKEELEIVNKHMEKN